MVSIANLSISLLSRRLSFKFSEKINARKRARDESNWQRNREKSARLSSHKGQPLPACRCRCYEKLTFADRHELLTQFNGLSSHTEQNIYLQGCCRQVPVARRRSRKEQHEGEVQISFILSNC